MNLNEMERRLRELETRVDRHEAGCTVRQEYITSRLSRIEYILIAVTGFVLVNLATIAFKVHG